MLHIRNFWMWKNKKTLLLWIQLSLVVVTFKACILDPKNFLVNKHFFLIFYKPQSEISQTFNFLNFSTLKTKLQARNKTLCSDLNCSLLPKGGHRCFEFWLVRAVSLNCLFFSSARVNFFSFSQTTCWGIINNASRRRASNLLLAHLKTFLHKNCAADNLRGKSWLCLELLIWFLCFCRRVLLFS